MRFAIKHSIVHHFADDTNILNSNKCIKTMRKQVIEDLNYLFDWLCSNRLSLNVAKTEFIIFRPPRKHLADRITLSLNGCKIFESTKVKYLGVILDSRLSWKHHIFELNKKLSRAVGMLYKLRSMNCDQRILLSLYFSLFQSHLTYGLVAWGFSKHIDRIAYTQKRAIRAIAGLKYNESSKATFLELKILTVPQLLQYNFASLMWDFDHSYLPRHLSSFFQKNTQFS